MNRAKWAVLAAVCAGVLVAGGVLAQDDGGEQGMGEMPEWMKPTPEHAALLKSVGEFEVAGEMWMAPDAPVESFSATAKRESILGGLYVQETFRSEFGGMPFEGRLLLGYDTVRKQHVMVWCDNMSPVPSIGHGTREGNVITSTSEDPDMMTGNLKKTKTVVELAGDDKCTMAQYDVAADGSARMTMRLTYTRKK